MTVYSSETKDAFVAALAQIEMYPENWNQKTWRCNSGLCLFGTIADQSPEVSWLYPFVPRDDYMKYGNPTEEERDAYMNAYTLDNAMEVLPWVVRRFELTTTDAALLYMGSNTIEDLRVMITQMKNDEPIIHPRLGLDF